MKNMTYNTGKWYQNGYVQEAIFFVAMFFLTLVHEWMDIDNVEGLFKALLYFLILYGQARLHRFFVFPYFVNKMYGAYILLALVTTLGGAVLLYVADNYWLYAEMYKDLHISTMWMAAYYCVICIISTIIMMSFYLLRQYSAELEKRHRDQVLLSEMNMKVLHSQLNPHFFFNMLNNLYGVSLMEPERTPDLILKLSGLMRYQLENGNKPSVSVSDEVNFIQNYVAMEKERIGKRCHITLEMNDKEANMGSHRIAPLLLIILVENAFKHSLTRKGSWFVNLELTLTADTLRLYIRNSIPDNSISNESTGIGLKNVRQRLELLYKNQYDFTFKKNDYGWETKLVLELNQF